MIFAVNTQLEFPQPDRGRAAFKFNTVNSFWVESSWKNLSDTGEVVVAKQLLFNDRKKVFDLIKSGDPVVLKGGYNGEFTEEFVGYVSEIQDSMPLVLKLEDNMYHLKRTQVHKSYEAVKLETLLKAIVPSRFKINAIDVELGSVYLPKTTVSQTLQHLKDHYGIYSYFVGDTLVSGKIYLDNTEEVKLAINGFNKNVVANDLRYRRKEDINLKVTMTSYLSDGTKKSITVGDEGGEEIKLVCANVENAEEIKKLAKKDYDRLKIDGLSGTVTTFANPYIKHGYTIDVVNNEVPNQEGKHYVDAVRTSLNDHGEYHRVSTLGPRAA